MTQQQRADELRETIRARFQAGLDSLLTGDLEPWVSMWAEEGCMEFPYAPPGFPQRLEGQAAIRAHMRAFPQALHLTRLSVPVLYPTVDPTVLIAEFSCEGRAVATGRPYHQRYISVIQTGEEGRILHYRDYWNPWVVLEALGGVDTALASFRPQAGGR
jgi:uncharacterized protein